MRKLGWTGATLGLFLAIAVLSYVVLWGQSPAAEGAPGTNVGIDTDTTGNTATSLGATESCVSVSPGQQFDIDVFVNEIPAGRNFAGFNYEINFDGSRVNIIAQNHSLLLASASGSSILDLSDGIPDSVTPHSVAVADFGTAEVGPKVGVLGRYTLEVAPAATTGTFTISLTTIDLVDSASEPIIVDQVLDASIAVGEACSGA